MFEIRFGKAGWKTFAARAAALQAAARLVGGGNGAAAGGLPGRVNGCASS